MPHLRRITGIALALALLEALEFYGISWLKTGTADPRCAFLSNYLTVFFFSKHGHEVRCERVIP
jgi:hypothetical protein